MSKSLFLTLTYVREKSLNICVIHLNINNLIILTKKKSSFRIRTTKKNTCRQDFFIKTQYVLMSE